MALQPKYTPVEIATFISTINENHGTLTDAIKSYVDDKASISEADIKALIQAGDTELRGLISADTDKLAALVSLLDAVDGQVDGEITMASVIVALKAQDTVASNEILANTHLITGVQTALNKEISDRMTQGTTFTTAIADAKAVAVQLISDLEVTVNSLLGRMSIVESTLVATTTATNNLADGLISIGKQFKSDAAKFALPVANPTPTNVLP